MKKETGGLFDLFDLYRVPKDRWDLLIFFCIINGRLRDLNKILSFLDLPLVNVEKPDPCPIYDFYSVFYPKKVDLETSREMGTFIELIFPTINVLEKLRDSIAEELLPKYEWFKCLPRKGCYMLTPCSNTECPSYTNVNRVHCDKKFDSGEMSHESVATKEGVSVGKIDHLVTSCLKYLGSLSSGIPQKLHGVGKSLHFDRDGCAFCGSDLIEETFDGYGICSSCVAERPLSCSLIELEFGLPIEDAVRLVKKCHSSFQAQADALTISLTKYGEILSYLKLETMEVLDPKFFENKNSSRETSLSLKELLLPMFASLLVKTSDNPPSKEIFNEFSYLSKDIEEALPVMGDL